MAWLISNTAEHLKIKYIQKVKLKLRNSPGMQNLKKINENMK